MQEGDLDFAMYLMAAKHFRPPLRLALDTTQRTPFFPPADEDSYFVVDDLEQTLGLIRVFVAEDAEQEGDLQKMIQGIRFADTLGLTECELSAPMDFADAKIESIVKNYLALFSIPEGKTLLTHIQYANKQREFSLERTQGLEILRSGYQQLARALADLHTKRFSPVCTISEYYWKAHMDACRAAVKPLRRYAEVLPFEVDAFAEKLVQMAALAYSRPCSAAFVHGGLALHAVTYEPFNETIALLDLEKLYHSVGERGVPCGPSAYDFVWAEASFELGMTFCDAGNDEIQDIVYDYRAVYKQLMRDRYPKELHLTFYSVLFWLPIYRSLVVKTNGNESLLQGTEKRIFRLAYQKITPVLTFSMEKS